MLTLVVLSPSQISTDYHTLRWPTGNLVAKNEGGRKQYYQKPVKARKHVQKNPKVFSYTATKASEKPKPVRNVATERYSIQKPTGYPYHEN